jgi:hypothetical protein
VHGRKSKGRRGGPAASQAVGGERLGTSGCREVTRKEREGERRLMGGPAHGMGPIRQRNEESGRETGRWAWPQFN